MHDFTGAPVSQFGSAACGNTSCLACATPGQVSTQGKKEIVVVPPSDFRHNTKQDLAVPPPKWHENASRTAWPTRAIRQA